MFQQRKMVSKKAFRERGLSAADKLRLLASALAIPPEIPSQFSALHGRRGHGWEDAMDAITGIRNNIVHPGEETKLPGGSTCEVWKLSLWYLDLVLLRLCGHEGEYSNRLQCGSKGELQSVPWVQA